jgi:hypothetical protein
MAAFPVRQWRHDCQKESHGVRNGFSLACDSAYLVHPPSSLSQVYFVFVSSIPFVRVVVDSCPREITLGS